MAEPPVVDASPLVLFARVGRLDLLREAGDRILVPAAVAGEVRAHSDEGSRALGDEARWLEVVPSVPVPEAVSAWDLGDGESAVLSWELAHPGTVAIIDDFAARKCSEVLGVPVKGTLGLVLSAKRSGRIPTSRPVVEALRRAGLYVSDALIAEALSLVEE